MPISVRASGRLAFRSAPLIVSGTLRIGANDDRDGPTDDDDRGTVALTLLPVARAPRRIAHARQATIQLTFRHGATSRARRLSIRLSP